jgi:hypothetical protein
MLRELIRGISLNLVKGQIMDEEEKKWLTTYFEEITDYQEEQTQYQSTIKNILVFFTVITILGIIIEVLSLLFRL